MRGSGRNEAASARDWRRFVERGGLVFGTPRGASNAPPDPGNAAGKAVRFIQLAQTREISVWRPGAGKGGGFSANREMIAEATLPTLRCTKRKCPGLESSAGNSNGRLADRVAR